MSETAPASKLLVDNNQANNAAVDKTIRFHGRHNDQNDQQRQPLFSALCAICGTLPGKKIKALHERGDIISENQPRTSRLSRPLIKMPVHQDELPMNDNLSLHSDRISYVGSNKRPCRERGPDQGQRNTAKNPSQRHYALNQSHPIFAAWKLLTEICQELFHFESHR